MNLLEQVTVEGFRSIKSATVALRPLNVFIGANGAGKSNLIGFLQMLRYAVSGGLQTFVQRYGPASALLHFGPKITPVMRGVLGYQMDTWSCEYRFALAHAAGDTLIFTHEEAQFLGAGDHQPDIVNLGSGGHRESGVAQPWAGLGDAVRLLQVLLLHRRVYQFHDTSPEASIRNRASQDDNQHLSPDGGNLPALLLRLREEDATAYQEIERTLHLVLPWFEGFTLEAEGQAGKANVLLRWRMKGHPEYDLGPGQLSDGSLRTMALITLLVLRPPKFRHWLIVLDEPELGLHPAGEAIVAGLIKAAAQTGQVIISTQSATLLDHFSAEDVIVVENQDGHSTFQRQEPDKLRAWLERYTLGQLWLKNLMGGRP